MLCLETACGVICIVILTWFFAKHMMGECRATCECCATRTRSEGYLIYPYVDLVAPGPDGDQYALHSCRRR